MPTDEVVLVALTQAKLYIHALRDVLQHQEYSVLQTRLTVRIEDVPPEPDIGSPACPSIASCSERESSFPLRPPTVPLAKLADALHILEEYCDRLRRYLEHSKDPAA